MTDVHIMSDRTFGGRRRIVVRVGVDMSVSRVVAFQGPSAPGYPGPVYVAAGGRIESRVDSPERFGQTFGPDWVRSFFA